METYPTPSSFPLLPLDTTEPRMRSHVMLGNLRETVVLDVSQHKATTNQDLTVCLSSVSLTPVYARRAILTIVCHTAGPFHPGLCPKSAMIGYPKKNLRRRCRSLSAGRLTTRKKSNEKAN